MDNVIQFPNSNTDPAFVKSEKERLEKVKKYQIDLENPKPDAYNEAFVNEINQVVGQGLLPNKNAGQKIQFFNNQFKNVNGTQV